MDDPSSDDWEEPDPKHHILIGVVSLGALGTIVLSSMAYASRSLWTVEQLVQFDMGETHTGWWPPNTTRRIYLIMIFVGSALLLASLVGAIASALRIRPLVSVYTLTSKVFALVLLLVSVLTVERQFTMAPLITRQVDDLCDPSTYIRLSKNLPCKWASPGEPPTCSDICEERVSLLRELDACTFLPRLCMKWNYVELSGYQLDYEPGINLYVKPEVTFHDCREACDADIHCRGFLHTDGFPDGRLPRCVVRSGGGRPEGWTMIPASRLDAGSHGFHCHVRMTSYAVGQYKLRTWLLALAMLGLGIVLMASSLYTLALTYNMNVRRMGSPSAFELARMLFCPCCDGGAYQKYRTPPGIGLE